MKEFQWMGQSCPISKPEAHSVCLQSKYKGYPKRVLPKKIPWHMRSDGYANHPIYTDEKILRGTAYSHPEDISQVSLIEINSYFPITFDKKTGLPLNPVGRTGLGGRGILGKWGANFAADAIITYRDKKNTYLLVIKRKDTGEWALPGGMCDPGEIVGGTAKRELKEETGVNLKKLKGKLVYCGYVDDPRNTDNSWMETVVIHWHLKKKYAKSLKLKRSDESPELSWEVVDDSLLNSMFASHASFVKDALHL